MNKKIESILVDEKEIAEICERLGKQITKDYQEKNLLVIGLMKGALPFMQDLIKKIDLDILVDYIKVSSYEGTSSTGTISINNFYPFDVKGKDVLLIDDVLDTGLTLKKLTAYFKNLGANSVKTCVLLDKVEGRKYNYDADYVGKKIPLAFVVGYGLDFNETLRNLPYVGILKKEYYAKEND